MAMFQGDRQPQCVAFKRFFENSYAQCSQQGVVRHNTAEKTDPSDI